MRPRLTDAGRALGLAVLALVAMGALAGSPWCAALSTLCLSLLIWSRLSLLTRPLTAIKLAFSLPEPPRVGLLSPVEVELGLPPGEHRLSLALEVGGGGTSEGQALLIYGGLARFTLYLTPSHAGPSLIFGLRLTRSDALGLMAETRHFPCEYPFLATLPPVAASPRLGAPRALGPSGALLARTRPGSGTELRELRDYQPGDPFKAVAWRATARLGRPIVRQTEDEESPRVSLLLDIAPTLRTTAARDAERAPGARDAAPRDRPTGRDQPTDAPTGARDAAHRDRPTEAPTGARDAGRDAPTGARTKDERRPAEPLQPLQLGQAWIQSFLKRHRRGQVGLTTYDHRVHFHQAPGAGARTKARLLSGLYAAGRVVDEDLTEITDSELLVQVGLFLEHQVGRSFRRPPEPPKSLADPLGELFDKPSVFAEVTHALSIERALALSTLEGRTRPAEDLISARLRLYCELKDLALPYRLVATAEEREAGLLAALAKNQDADALVVLTDLKGLSPQGRGFQALLRLGPRLTVALLATPPEALVRLLTQARARVLTVSRSGDADRSLC